MSQIIEITDFNAKELDVYARLTEAELLHLYEPKGGIFIAESPKVITRALDAGYEPVSLLLERKHIEMIKDLAKYAENDLSESIFLSLLNEATMPLISVS